MTEWNRTHGEAQYWNGAPDRGGIGHAARHTIVMEPGTRGMSREGNGRDRGRVGHGSRHTIGMELGTEEG